MTEHKMRLALMDARQWHPRKLVTHLVLHPEDLMAYLLAVRNRAVQMMPSIALPNFPTFERRLKATSTRLVFMGVTVITDESVPRGDVRVV